MVRISSIQLRLTITEDGPIGYMSTTCSHLHSHLGSCLFLYSFMKLNIPTRNVESTGEISFCIDFAEEKKTKNITVVVEDMYSIL